MAVQFDTTNNMVHNIDIAASRDPRVVTLKIGVAVFVFLTSAGAIVFRLKYAESCCSKAAMDLCNVAAAGMFVGMALNHLLPEAAELAPPLDKPVKINLVGVCAFCGFGFILFCERIIGASPAPAEDVEDGRIGTRKNAEDEDAQFDRLTEDGIVPMLQDSCADDACRGQGSDTSISISGPFDARDLHLRSSPSVSWLRRRVGSASMIESPVNVKKLLNSKEIFCECLAKQCVEQRQRAYHQDVFRSNSLRGGRTSGSVSAAASRCDTPATTAPGGASWSGTPLTVSTSTVPGSFLTPSVEPCSYPGCTFVSSSNHILALPEIKNEGEIVRATVGSGRQSSNIGSSVPGCAQCDVDAAGSQLPACCRRDLEQKNAVALATVACREQRAEERGATGGCVMQADRPRLPPCCAPEGGRTSGPAAPPTAAPSDSVFKTPLSGGFDGRGSFSATLRSGNAQQGSSTAIARTSTDVVDLAMRSDHSQHFSAFGGRGVVRDDLHAHLNTAGPEGGHSHFGGGHALHLHDQHDHGVHALHLHDQHDHHAGVVGAYVIMLALSTHSIFEGLVIGMASTLHAVLLVSACVVCHKWAAAFALGTAFSNAKVDTKRAIVCLMIFACASPLGVAIGIIVSVSVSEYVQGLLNAMAAGTLLYIGLTEVIPEEFARTSNPKQKILALSVGYMFIVCVQMMDAD